VNEGDVNYVCRKRGLRMKKKYLKIAHTKLTRSVEKGLENRTFKVN